MEYKMRDVVRITGLPRTTIQGYYPDKRTESLTPRGGGGPQWTFNDKELEDLWLIKVCMGIGKNKKEIQILRDLTIDEKRMHLKSMLDTLQDYVRMANMYVEARPAIILFLNIEDSSLEASKLFFDIWLKSNEAIEEDKNIFKHKLSKKASEKILDLLFEIADQSDKISSSDDVLQDQVAKIDKLLDKMIKNSSIRKFILSYLISELEDLSVEEEEFILEVLSHFYSDTEDLDSLFGNLINPIYENSYKVSYTSSLIQKYVNDIYLFYKGFGLNKNYLDRIMKLLRDFYGSKENIDKYENGLENGFMLYFSKAIETFIYNNVER
jgi:hypothetical protein